MKIYTLKFSDDGHGVARRVEFRADDLTAALIIAHREASRRTAELWEGAKKLCNIRKPSEVPASLTQYAF